MEPGKSLRWAVAKLVRHQALDLAFEGSNPSRPALRSCRGRVANELLKMSERAKDELEVFTGNSNIAVAREVCEHLSVRLGEAEVARFPDGEVMVEIRENVRGGDCFVIQSTCSPPNDNLMELLLIMDALRRASAKRITA